MLRIWLIRRNLLSMKHSNRGIALVGKRTLSHLMKQSVPWTECHRTALEMKKKKDFQHKAAAPHLLKHIRYYNSCVKWCITGVFMALAHGAQLTEDRGHAVLLLLYMGHSSVPATQQHSEYLFTRYTTTEGSKVWVTEKLTISGCCLYTFLWFQHSEEKKTKEFWKKITLIKSHVI